jgi:hypothetical protein
MKWIKEEAKMTVHTATKPMTQTYIRLRHSVARVQEENGAINVTYAYAQGISESRQKYYLQGNASEGDSMSWEAC